MIITWWTILVWDAGVVCWFCMKKFARENLGWYTIYLLFIEIAFTIFTQIQIGGLKLS